MNNTLPQWETQKYYYGFNPVGDYVILSKNRNSSLLEQSNFEVAQKLLLHAAWNNKLQCPPRPPACDKETPRYEGYIYTHCASHWACGWIEYLMIRHEESMLDNPAYQILLNIASAILSSLDNYPVLDDNAYWDKQYNTINEYWDNMDYLERIDYCKQANCNIFAACRDTVPIEVYDLLIDKNEFK